MEFRFKNQRYQEDAAAAVVSVFQGQPKQDAFTYLRDKGKGVTRKGMVDMFYDLMLSDEGYANAPVQLSATQLLDNIRKIQRANNIAESDELFDDLGACQLDIEMETGTGKTYVYTKTMLELNEAFGWTKFIIVVPGIAIREGVFKSLQNTEQHFFEQYGRKINFFIYDSDNLTELDRYSESSDICAMIINMQAFNTSMKEGANNKQARIIFDERDEFGSRKPIDVIAANRPIIIQDEPQKMGGKATQAGIKRSPQDAQATLAYGRVGVAQGKAAERREAHRLDAHARLAHGTQQVEALLERPVEAHEALVRLVDGDLEVVKAGLARGGEALAPGELWGEGLLVEPEHVVVHGDLPVQEASSCQRGQAAHARGRAPVRVLRRRPSRAPTGRGPQACRARRAGRRAGGHRPRRP